MGHQRRHYSKCPSCKSEGTLRNFRTRNTSEKIVKYVTWFDLYKCKQCGWRGWKAGFVLKKQSLIKLIINILLMIAAAFVVYNLLKLVV
jgi:uncharacterized Zn finger protein